MGPHQPRFKSHDGLEEGGKDDILEHVQNIISAIERAAKKTKLQRDTRKEVNDIERELETMTALVLAWAHRPRPTFKSSIRHARLDDEARALIRELNIVVQTGLEDELLSQTDEYAQQLQEKADALAAFIRIEVVAPSEIWESPEEEVPDVGRDDMLRLIQSMTRAPELDELDADVDLETESAPESLASLEMSEEWFTPQSSVEGEGEAAELDGEEDERQTSEDKDSDGDSRDNGGGIGGRDYEARRNSEL